MNLFLKWSTGNVQDFISVFPRTMFVPRMKHDYSYKLYQHINPHSCEISICKFLFSLVILSDRAPHLMTSNPGYSITHLLYCHFHKSLALLVKIRLWLVVNTLRPRQNGRHFADDTFNRIFVNENVGILIKFSLKFVPKGPINNIPALVQTMAWRRPGLLSDGTKPLHEPMLTYRQRGREKIIWG